MHDNWLAKEAADLLSITREIIAAYPTQKKYMLSGQLGAGKTTMVKAFCENLGILEGMSSPSFGIVHQYGQDPIVYHFDLYRLQSASELREIGMDDYLDSPHWIFIEWPEIAADVLKEEGFFHLDIHTMENNQRMINLEK